MSQIPIIAKRVVVTHINSHHGEETIGEEREVKGGYFTFPEPREGYDAWGVFLPLSGTEDDPDTSFYRYGELPEKEVVSQLEGRRHILVYRDADLTPNLAPRERASHLFIASEDQSYCLRCGEPEYHAAHYGKRKIDRESERDSTHPKDRLSTAWQEFIANVGIDHPETHCTVCGLVTWNAWRTGFCLPHFETTNELTKAGQDWLPDETELLHQESGIPLCPECGTNHDMTPELIDNLHNPRHCEMCGSVHRRVDPCPPSATIPNASYGMATTAQQKEAIINKAASMLGVKESEQLRAAINEADKRIVDAIQNTPGRASSDIDGGDPARPHILAENEHLTIYSSSEHLSPAMGAALAGILDAMTVEPWVCIHHNEPVTYTMGQTGCELCGRTKDEQ